jgi:hypothetical protein
MALSLQLVPADLKAGLDALIVHLMKVTDENYARSGFNIAKPKWDYQLLSDKWVRVDRVDPGHSVYCFVAIQDFSNKQLGQVRRGDIHRGATFKAPSKHARGNVLTQAFSDCGPYGPAYLK